VNVQRQNVLLLVMSAAAGVTPSWGQTVALPPSASAQISAPFPDFSGLWSHPSLTGFEPPLSGPGPVLNKSRLRGGPQNGRGNFNELVGDFSNPILKPEAAEAVKKHGEISLAGVAYPTPSNQCWPGGVPYIFWNFAMQMLQQQDKITIIYYFDNEFRQVRMNQPHPARVAPSWYGDSVGHYEGDTLVVDTVAIKIGPFAMIDMYGTPHSPGLHVVERYRLLDYEATKAAAARDEKENFQIPPPGPADGLAVDRDYKGNGLQLEFTVEDEGVFTTPWSATITYRRPLLTEGGEYICAENIHQYYSGKDAAVPRADKPDF
jgi:hypothetical protein